VRAFSCAVCGLLQPFESHRCVRCGSEQGFVWPQRLLVAEPRARCANVEIAACNWVPAQDGTLCFSCALTRTRPPDGDVPGLTAFAQAEGAKRWLLFELGELGLPLPDGLAFDLLSSAHEPVVTGHANGLVTLDLAEADDAHRTAMREQMSEPYRTLLGHMRHETGHAYFELLAAADLERVRARFGDERADYQAALDRHYAAGPPDDWADSFVSAYATMHPSEDWAETFAHVLHIRDSLQTAAEHGVRVGDSNPRLTVTADLRALLGDWLALSYALNAINRSMGLDDLYPFVLPDPVVDKLALVDALIRQAAR
jgi:hypothetical protein